MSQPCQTHVCAGSTSSLRSTCCTAFGKIVCLRETKSVRACVSTYHSTRAHAYPHVHTHRHRAERAEMQQALREDAAVLTALARDSPQAFSQVCVSECRVHAETVRNMFSLSLSLSLTHTHTHSLTHTTHYTRHSLFAPLPQSHTRRMRALENIKKTWIPSSGGFLDGDEEGAVVDCVHHGVGVLRVVARALRLLFDIEPIMQYLYTPCVCT